jgi:hypothetical protein
MNKCAICDYCKDAIVVEDIPDTPTEPPPPLPSIEDTEGTTSDSESQVHNVSDVLSVGQKGVVTPTPSASRLPPMTEWYEAAGGPATSTQCSTSGYAYVNKAHEHDYDCGIS